MSLWFKRGLFTAAVVSIGLMGVRTNAHQRQRFQATLHTTSRVVAPPAGRCSDEPNQAPVVGLLEATGVGDASLLGPVIDEQSHCLRADGTFFRGVFRLNNDDGTQIRGRYFGNLEPTFNSIAGPPPGGVWLVRGWVCIKGGNAADILDDCVAGRYEPARGITNLSTGDATIVLDQPISVR